jgi:hypothetical protein
MLDSLLRLAIDPRQESIVSGSEEADGQALAKARAKKSGR